MRDGWTPDDGAGYIPTEEGGAGRDTSPIQSADSARGCPVCGWRGEVARTHERAHSYYTHIIVRDGEVFEGSTCSERTRPRDPGLLSRLWRWLHA